MGSPPLKPADAQHHNAHDATPYQASTQQQTNSESFWVRTFGDPIATFTLVLAITTVCLLIANLLLWLTNRKIVGFMGRQTTVAETQSELVRQQVALEGLQSDILEKQKEIARLQFLAEHRPKLLLKDVYFSGADGFTEVSFEVVNSGESTAVITGGFVALDFISDPRQFKQFVERDLGPLANCGFKGGQFRPFALRISEEDQRKLEFLDKVGPERRAAAVYGPPEDRPPLASNYYFFGMIFYSDERGSQFGATYATVFRRKWNPEFSRFERTGNPDHEYAD